MIRTFFAGIVAISFSAAGYAQTAEQPKVKAGDTWVYQLTTEKAPNGWIQTRNELIVERTTSSAIYLNVKQLGSTQPSNEIFLGLDWSRVRNVNGKETLVNRPLAFPLTVGKTWDLGFEEHQPNRQFTSEQRNRKYTVIGYETVEVPAGKFTALKVESEGQWIAELAPAQNVVQSAQSGQNGASLATQVQKIQAGTKVMGRLYSVMWYAPEVKRWVKSVEEEYNSAGSRGARYTSELVSFKVGE